MATGKSSKKRKFKKKKREERGVTHKGSEWELSRIGEGSTD
jgi:hypothetical protein